MSRILQLRRGTSIELDAITGAEGEIFVDLTNNTLRIHNSVIQGGTSLASETYVNNEVSTAIADLASETYVDNAIAAIEVDFSMIMEDIIPAISGVYDIGTPDHQWYNGYFANKVDINGIEFTNIGDNDLQITAETIITDSDLLANSLLLDDIFITGNIIKPLSTPLYGQREVIVDGGLHVASEDAAYIRLTQEIPVTEKTVSQRFSNVEDGYAFNWSTSYNENSFGFLLDVSQLAPGFPQEMWVFNQSNDEYTQILADQLVPGLKYKIEIEIVYGQGFGAPFYSYDRIVLDSYLFENVEYVGSEVFVGSLYLKFKSPVPGSSAMIGANSYDTNIGNFYAGADFVISAESTTIEYDYSVLDTYGSEGMIRFNPEIKKFEGHDGTKWDSVTAVDPATVYVKNASLSVTTSLTVNESDAGCFNNFFGYQAGNSNTSGSNNNFFGFCAGRNNTTGSCNNFFGSDAGGYNTSGSFNNFFGCNAGRNNTTGNFNNFFGQNAGRYNSTGSENNFFGRCAGFFNTTGSRNNFFGLGAGQSNTTGSYNNFFGLDAGVANTTGSCNNFFGHTAGRSNTEGCRNNFIGFQAGFANTTGSCNNFIGSQAGINNYTGSNNLLLGLHAGVVDQFATVGLANITTESNRIIMGNCLHSCAQIQVAWTVVSDERDKCIFGSVPHGRGFLQNLETVEYAFKDRETGCITDPEGKHRYGFTAQNVLAAEGDTPVIVSADNPDKLQLTSDYMIPVLVNAINELSREVDNIINENKTLKDRILNLEQK